MRKVAPSRSGTCILLIVKSIEIHLASLDYVNIPPLTPPI